jgi:hypothetical protein
MICQIQVDAIVARRWIEDRGESVFRSFQWNLAQRFRSDMASVSFSSKVRAPIRKQHDPGGRRTAAILLECCAACVRREQDGSGVLLLDEPTAGLDSSYQLGIAGLYKAPQRRTGQLLLPYSRT